MIRIALIGCGAWGSKYPHAAMDGGGYVTHIAGAGVTPWGGCSHIPSREWRKLIGAPVDAFIVATPPDTHEEICTALLDAGRPVMVEKPLALSANEANRIVGATERTGVPIIVNHQHLFAPAYEALRDVVSGWNGKTIMSVGEGPGPHRDYSALWDYGPHDVAMTLGLVPSGERLVPKSVRTFRGDGPGMGFDVMSRSETIKSTVTVSNCARFKARSLWVQSGDRAAHYDDLAEHKLKINDRPVDISPERPLTLAVRAFAEAVRTGRTDWRFGRFGADVVGFLDQAQQLQDRQQEARDAHH